MSNNFNSKADYRRMVGASRPATAGNQATALKSSLSASQIHSTLSTQVGSLDLGFIGNIKSRMHQHAEDSKMQKTLTTARVEHATTLMLEKISGEVEILRMAFKQDFSDRIASLAESAAASQIMVIRKLKAIEAEARNFVMYDLKHELDELTEMHAQGVIDDEDLKSEAAFRFHRYEQLKDDFVKLMTGYQAVVQTAYQGQSR